MANIELTKKVYGLKGALSKLDEEFDEFAIRNKTPEEWFNMWDKVFYDLNKKTHQYLFHKSQRFAYGSTGYTNPRQIEINNLKKRLMEIQKQIDSLEVNHFYFQNNSFLLSSAYENNAQAGISAGAAYFMHSGKRRQITGGAVDSEGNLRTPTAVFNNLKTRKLKSLPNITSQDLIIFISINALNMIPEGPNITQLKDINLTPLEVNIYPRTLDEYNNLIFTQMFPNLITNTPGYATPVRDILD